MTDTRRVRNQPNDATLADFLLGQVHTTLVSLGLLQHFDARTPVSTADSSSLATSKALAKALADAFAAHGADTDVHVAADATLGTLAAAYTSTPALPADLTEVQNILNELKAEINLHIPSVVYHRGAGGKSGGVAALTLITVADATNQGTADALANELKACFNRHVVNGIEPFLVD